MNRMHAQVVARWSIIMVLGLVLGGCGQASTAPLQPAPHNRASGSGQLQPSMIPSQVIPFEITTLEGLTFSVPAIPGRPVILFFSAAWCSSCLAEAQALAQVAETYRAETLDILILDIDPNDTVADVQRFREAAGLPQHWALDNMGSVARAYQIRALDTTIIFNAQGTIVYQDTTSTSVETLDTAVQQALR